MIAIAILDQQLRTTRTAFDQEHTPDGAHSDVTAERLTLQGARVGEWTALPYDAVRYAVDGGTSWTVSETDQVYLRMFRTGQQVTVQFYLQETVIVGAPTRLMIRLPELHAVPVRNAAGNPATQMGGMCEWTNVTAGTSGIATCAVVAEAFAGAIPSTTLYLRKFGGAAAAYEAFAATAEFWIQGFVTCVVEVDNAPHPFFGA